MAMVSCRECGEVVSSEAKACPHCGVKDPARSSHYLKIGLGLIGWVVIIWLVVGSGFAGRIIDSFGNNSRQQMVANPNCRITNFNVEHATFTINNEPDYGVNIRFTIANDKDSTVTVDAKLLTSEGDYSRTREVQLRRNDPRQVTIGFPEPTILATDISGQAACR